MTDEDNTADVEALLRKQIAEGNKLAGLGFMLLMAAKARSEGSSQADAEAIEKISVTPEAQPGTYSIASSTGASNEKMFD